MSSAAGQVDAAGARIERLIAELAERLIAVEGIVAVALGGSRARGTHRPDSDVDLGLYYEPAAPPALEALSRLVAEIDDRHRSDLLTPLGGWGPRIDGGGWLRVSGVAVDLLYRDLERMRACVARCREGEVEVAIQPGHPFGFVSTIHFAELAVCRPLADPRGALAELRRAAAPYPPALQRALVERFAWEPGFALDNAAKAASRADVAYAAGCLFHATGCLLQVLFALNREPWMNEKGALAIADRLPLAPPRLRERVEGAFGALAPSPAAIEAAIAEMRPLVAETAALVESWQR